MSLTIYVYSVKRDRAIPDSNLNLNLNLNRKLESETVERIVIFRGAIFGGGGRAYIRGAFIFGALIFRESEVYSIQLKKACIFL
jgi:hypothetical protein